jgi:signal transduction histidine kinase
MTSAVGASSPPVRWWRTRSLRARLTLVATALLAAGLAASAVLLVVTVARSLQAGVDAGALQSAEEIAALVDGDRLPDPVPVGGETAAVVQVVDSEGRVRAASAGADRLVSLLRPDELARARSGERLIVDGDRAGLAGPLRVVAVPAGRPGDPQTVVVAVGNAGVQDGVRVLRTGLLLGGPLLLAGLALVSWWVIGWALRPVDLLRRGAEEISGTGGSRRLPLPEARDELRRLAVTLNDMLARLDAASARQRAFVADAAHELRSPLASIRTQLEVAARLDGELGGAPVAAARTGTAVHTVGEVAQDVLVDVERLSRLIDDLLLLARLDDAAPDRLLRRRVPLDLAVLADDVGGRYANARVPVTVVTAGPVPVQGDPDGLDRAIANLLDNAVRHARSSVRLDVSTVDGSAVVTVTDDGPGIPPADRDRVFDRFTRLDSARTRDEGGAGLGLPIVRELVRAHGGTVTLTDADPGLRATITLPTAHRQQA